MGDLFVEDFLLCQLAAKSFYVDCGGYRFALFKVLVDLTTSVDLLLSMIALGDLLLWLRIVQGRLPTAVCVSELTMVKLTVLLEGQDLCHYRHVVLCVSNSTVLLLEYVRVHILYFKKRIAY